VQIPAGNFQMGAPASERYSDSNERPVHTVTVAYDIYIAKYELTQRQWLAVMGTWPGTPPDSTYGVGDNYPAYYISWLDCQNFITALNDHISSTAQGPATFRLPSEAEWEYACRAGTQTRFYFGDSLDAADDCSDAPAGVLPGNRTDYMWYCGNNSTNGTKPVGSKSPNQFGLYDMHGNVVEWCQDWWHNNYNGAPEDGSAWETPVGLQRIIRGGCWYFEVRYCRSADRNSAAPGGRGNYLGLRVLRTQ
jgi:formylglycine-generating enzyme required for sulfatase activity